MNTYKPGYVPDDPKALVAFLRAEFLAIQQANERAEPLLRLVPTTVAPTKYQDGEVYLASSPWDPGNGSGLYIRREGAWYRFTDAVVTPPVYATWNPSDKAASITLSNGNLTSTTTGSTNATVRSTIGKSTGKWYWEYTFSSGPARYSAIANSTASLTGYPGSDANGWMYFSDGTKYNAATPTAYGATYANGDVLGVALDMTAGTIIFYKNNASQGTAYTGLTGTIFAATGTSASSTSAVVCTANFGATALTYTPPAGYNAGLYS